MLDCSLNFRLLGDVALHCLDGAGHVRDDFLGFADGFVEGGCGDVAHEHRCAFAEEEDGRFQTDTAGGCKPILMQKYTMILTGSCRWSPLNDMYIPSCSGDEGVLASQSAMRTGSIGAVHCWSSSSQSAVC